MTRLELAGVSAGYGGGTVLHRIDLAVRPGTVHAIVGHNGAGKTTLVHTVAGLRPAYAGRVLVGGHDLTGRPAHQRCRAGVGLVPQGRRVFPSLTVAEHLAIARRPGPWTPAGVLDLLPALAARRAHRGAHLSGGEQQLLAIARALLTQPLVLLLDEPTEGLAPRIATQIEQLIGELSGSGLTVLLAAPAPGLALAVADDLTVLATGRITHRLAVAEVRCRPDLLTHALTPTGGDR